VGQEERLLAYPWSSLVWYVAAKPHRPSWMRVDRLLGEHGIQQNNAARGQQFEQYVENDTAHQMDCRADGPGHCQKRQYSSTSMDTK
jgi:hypothetical protein